MSTLAQDAPASPQQIDDLKSVGDQCVLSGGDAVTRARALFRALTEASYNPDDVAICTQTEERVINQELLNGMDYQITLSPNPAKDQVLIKVQELANGVPIQVQVYDLNGKLFRNITLNNGDYCRPSLNNGIFICRVYQEGKILGYAKLVIIP